MGAGLFPAKQELDTMRIIEIVAFSVATIVSSMLVIATITVA